MWQKSILDTIGNTPLVRLNLGSKNDSLILAKLEFLNPGGSIKDRMALYMVKKAEKRGTLKPGMTIIEATSGNTGIALGMIVALKGYKMIAVMPGNMSVERQQIMRSFGVKVILTPAEKGFQETIEKRDSLAKKIPHSWIPDQFGNYDNVLVHWKTTGREIIKQTGGKVDVFVAGVGTGGTLIGVAKALKKVNPEVKIIAVEPEESAVLSGERAGIHNIQGIGEGFIPKLVDLKMINRILKVSTKEAEEMTRLLAKKEGILAGTSSGANVVASLRIAEEMGREKIVVTVLPDRGEHYLSQGFFK